MYKTHPKDRGNHTSASACVYIRRAHMKRKVATLARTRDSCFVNRYYTGDGEVHLICVQGSRYGFDVVCVGCATGSAVETYDEVL